MAITTNNQRSITKYEQDTNLLTWIEGMAIGTFYFYQITLNLFIVWHDLLPKTMSKSGRAGQIIFNIQDAAHL